MITMTLHQMILTLCQKNDFHSEDVDEQIEFARPIIFDFDYPFYSNERRPIFETKFLKHFLFREISADTPYRWYLYLSETFNLIMPYYNELFESTLYSYNPFENFFVHTEHKERTKTTDNITGNRNGTDNIKEENSKDTTESHTNTRNITENVKDDTSDKTEYGKTISDSGTDINTETYNKTRSRQDDKEHTVKIHSDTPQNNINFGVLTPGNIESDNGGYSNQYASEADDTLVLRGYTETESAGNGIINKKEHGKKETHGGTDTETINVTKDTTGKVTDTYAGTQGIKGKVGTDKTHNEDTKTDKLQRYLRTYTTDSSGLQGNYTKQQMILKLRETFINVERMIFNDDEVRSLFTFILE